MTAPKPSGKTGQNGTRRILAELSVPSEPGNERWAMDDVARIVREMGLPDATLDRLKTAVAEATMNAMEHGNQYRADVPVIIEVSASNADLFVRITDEGSGPPPVPDAETPDIEAKLEGTQTPRGWGQFLIKNMIDEMRVSGDEDHHTIELIVHLDEQTQGGK